MPYCECTTAKGNLCSLVATAKDTDGLWKCHVHHEQMAFRCQQRAKGKKRPVSRPSRPRVLKDASWAVEQIQTVLNELGTPHGEKVIHNQYTKPVDRSELMDGFCDPPFSPDN